MWIGMVRRWWLWWIRSHSLNWLVFSDKVTAVERKIEIRRRKLVINVNLSISYLRGTILSRKNAFKLFVSANKLRLTLYMRRSNTFMPFSIASYLNIYFLCLANILSFAHVKMYEHIKFNVTTKCDVSLLNLKNRYQFG